MSMKPSDLYIDPFTGCRNVFIGDIAFHELFFQEKWK
jgi:hypothetical protein